MSNGSRRGVWFALGLVIGLITLSPASAADTATQEQEQAESLPIKTVLIGQFFMRDLRVTEDAKVRLSFTLHAKIDPEHARVAERLVESHKHRLRNEVITAVRTCEQNEFQEPDLTRFRCRIQARLRRAMPQLPIEQLLVGEYEYLFE